MGLSFQIHVYESPGMSNSDFLAQRSLRGPLLAVICPCVDSYSCGIVPVLPASHWRSDAQMGPKMGDPLDDPLDSQKGETGPQWIVFGGATPLTKTVKTLLKWRLALQDHSMQICSNGSESLHMSTLHP
jgi:hypothetical protein